MKTITYFTSKTCAPCKALLPRVEKIADEENVQLFTIDIDENPELAQRVGVMSVPTILFTKGLAAGPTSPRLTPTNARPMNVRRMLESL